MGTAEHDANLDEAARGTTTETVKNLPSDNDLIVKKTPIFDDLHALMISKEEADILKRRALPSWIQEYFAYSKKCRWQLYPYAVEIFLLRR